MRLSLLILVFSVCVACAVPRPVAPGEAPLVDLPAAPAIAVPAAAPQSTEMRRTVPYKPGIFNLTLGARFLEDTSFWEPLDDQFALGLDYTMKQPGSFIGLNFGVQGAGARERNGVMGVDVDAWSIEAVLGPRIYLELPGMPFYAYGGAGGSLIYSEVKGLSGSTISRASEVAFGASFQGGVMYQMNQTQAVGLEYRTLQFTDFDGLNQQSSLDYNQVAFVFSSAF